jgi:hypothetical protein
MTAVVPDAREAAKLRYLIESHVVSQVVAEAARLGVADELADGPRPVRELAAATGAHEGALRRFLGACVAAGLLTAHDGDRFALTPLGAVLRSGEGSLRNYAISRLAPLQWRPWERLHDTILSGEPSQRAVLGMDMWEYLDSHPDEGYYFDRTMDELTAVVADKLIATVDFTRYGRIVDVGGGLGRLLGKVLAAAPRARGVLFDRADVIERAKADLASRGQAGRIEPVAGNFLEEAPPGGDLYLLKQVLCDWNDEHCRAILDSCYRAAPAGSTLLLIEVLRPDEVTSSPVHFFDLGLLLTLDGRIRTREEYRSLLESVGDRLGEVVTTAGGANSWSLLTAHKD